jgi:hypothetical protein
MISLHLLREWLEKHGLPVAVVSAGDMYEFFLNKRLLPVSLRRPRAKWASSVHRQIQNPTGQAMAA